MARDPYRYFRVEARELLDQLGQGALELDKGVAAPEVISRMLRFAHTLKGAARVVKQRQIADRAHAIEDALAPFRETDAAVPRDRIDAILKTLDDIALALAALAQSSPAQEPAGEGVAAAPIPAVPVQLDEPAEPARINVDETDALLEGLAEASVQLAALRQGAAPLERSRRLAQLLEEHLAVPRGDRLGAGRRVVPRRDDEVDLVAGEAGVLHLYPEGPAAAGAFHEPCRHDAVATTANDDIRPGRLQACARGVER